MVLRNAVDAVIIDICIPGLNDEELLPQLRMYQPELSGIIVSGYMRDFIWDMDEKTKLFSNPVDVPQLVLSLEEMRRYHTALQRVA
jgi:DNA-binding NtrC family response regulator